MLKYMPDYDDVKVHKIGCDLAWVGSNKTSIIVGFNFDENLVQVNPDYLIAKNFQYNGRVYNKMKPQNSKLFSEVAEWLLLYCGGVEKVFELFGYYYVDNFRDSLEY